MTYSIVARDAATGMLGVAVQSHWFSVGSVVTWAEAGVGAVATQAHAEPGYGPRGLALLRSGVDAVRALQELTAADEHAGRRQVAFVDADGGVAVHTGQRCIAEAGHVTGDGVSVQANMMRTASVWPAMLEAYIAASGDFAERLLVALEAGERAGGDVRGRQSAALLIVAAASSGQSWQDRVLELRVEDSADPLAELRRLVSLHRGYAHMEAAEEREMSGDLDAALNEYRTARAMLRDNDEASFWAAILMADSGRVEEGRSLLAEISAREPGWSDLLRRLPAAGMLRNGEATVRALLPISGSGSDVEEYLASLDDAQTIADSRALIATMRLITGDEPRIWNVGTIGFGSYHYRYESGREGDSHVLGFYPRKGKMTVYLMDGTSRHRELLEQLGKHTTSRVCVYIKRLGDVQLPVLEKVLRDSYEYITARDGRMQRVTE